MATKAKAPKRPRLVRNVSFRLSEEEGRRADAAMAKGGFYSRNDWARAVVRAALA